MTTVLASTDDVPQLADVLDRRRELGLDTYDEWWEGVYRIVTGPSPEHGELVARLVSFLLPLVDGAGLRISAPANIGRDKDDCRVPDVAVFGTDTPRTSPAFLASASLVIEVLSPHEVAGAKIDFYGRWGVAEYLEIDLPKRRVRLLRRTDAGWGDVRDSQLLGFGVEHDGTLRATAATYRITWPEE